MRQPAVYVFINGDGLENNNHSFVIRVWNEGNGDSSQKVWRGYIEHVNHGSRMYFSDLNGVARFIQQQIDFQSGMLKLRSPVWLSWVTNAITGFRKRLHRS
jgi:hypothetical protein